MMRAVFSVGVGNKLQQSIYQAMNLFACSLVDNKVRAGSLGLMEVIKAAMERHVSSEQVSEAGLDAIRSICVNGTCADLN